MDQEFRSPFDSIESAHGFIGLLAEVVAETKRDIDADIQREQNGKASRRVDALRLAAYSLEKLELHMNSSRRILNDLRSLRRLLFEERSKLGTSVSKAASTAKVDVSAPPLPARPLTQPPRAAGGNGATAVAA